MSELAIHDLLPEPIDHSPEIAFERQFRQAMAFVKGAITILSDLVKANSDDLTGMAHADVLVHQMRKQLSYLDDDIQKAMWLAMGDAKEAVIPGAGMLKKDFGNSNSAWQHDVIWAAIRKELRHAYASDETGELDPYAEAVMDKTMALVRRTISQGSYKKTGLKALGIEPDEVSTVSWGARKVKIIGEAK